MNQQQIDSLREALKFSPQNLPLRKLLADTLFNMSRYEEAIEEYKQALQLENNNIEIKTGLAESYFLLEKYSTAQVIVEELIENNPENATVLLLAAKIQLQTEDIRKAREYYNMAIRLNPTLADFELESALNQKIKNSGLAAENTVSFDEDSIEQLLAQADIEKPKISFKDVGGMKAIKDEIALKVIHPIKHPEIYKAYGKKTGGGILLYGPPGVGKTLLARATAGEIQSNFIAVGISEVLDMWIGNSEKNLHEIFQTARVNAPCVLFFDEVDALGASRSDMRKAAGRFLINQFLDELDGVKYSNEGILILGATNCPWYLDAAFRRPGRFDRVIFVQPPDLEARLDILKLLLTDKPTENIDFQHIARLTEEFSGADLKAIIDLAVELKLPESLRQGKVLPITTTDLKTAVSQHRATTKDWFVTAKNYALYSNESGLYDDILKYMKLKK
jgi:SpoVK/Ycf46/Vps4 family AAA+-type ATPase